MKVELIQDQLTNATKDNTTAIKSLTDILGRLENTLSYNKGIIWASFKMAAAGTAIIGGLTGFFMWLWQVVHK